VERTDRKSLCLSVAARTGPPFTTTLGCIMIAPLEPPSCPKCSTALRWSDIRASFRCHHCQAPLSSNANVVWGWGSLVLLLGALAAFDNMAFWQGLVATLGTGVVGLLLISVFVTVKGADADAT